MILFERLKPHYFSLIILSIFSIVLLFWELNYSVLQVDEGLDTFVSLTILKHGIPRHSDGFHSVMEYADVYDGLFVYRTWLPYYAQALSLGLFGKNTFAARFPFALAGLLSGYGLYFLGFRLTRKRSIGFFASLLLTFSVPALLYFRCARYIGFPALFSVLSIWTYLGIFERKKWNPWPFILTGFFYFHSMCVEFAGTLIGLAFHAFIYRHSIPPENQKRIKLALIILGLLTLPWLIFISPVFSKVYETYQTRGANFDGSVLGYFKRSLSFFFQLNNYVFPFILIPTLWLNSLKPKIFNINLLVLPSIATIFLATLNSIPLLQYIFACFPLLFLLLTLVIFEGFSVSKRIKAMTILLLLSTNVIHVGPLYPIKGILEKYINSSNTSRYLKAALGMFNEQVQWNSWLFHYSIELARPKPGTLDYVNAFFKDHGQAGETCFIDSEADSFHFYTQMKIIRTWQLKPTDQPDWIVLRSGKIDLKANQSSPYDIARSLRKIIKNNKYEKFEITSPIWRINNSYDIILHRFQHFINLKRITIYKRVKGALLQKY